jgi:hypothetical protein
VFTQVYEPVQGPREVLVPFKHVPEALDLIKTIKAELCRVMIPDSIQKAFIKQDDIITQAITMKPWITFDIQTTIPEAHTTHLRKKISLPYPFIKPMDSSDYQ